MIPSGDSLLVELPGGGFGDPARRDPALIEEDLKAGLITPESCPQRLWP